MKFSEEEKKYIINNYRNMKTKDIANNLKVEYSKVKGFVDNNRDKFNFNKGCRDCNLTYEQEEYIKSQYNKKTVKEISDILKLSIKDINMFAAYENLIFNSKKYNVDENYFEKINTPNKAYWLGFLYADGCILVRTRNNKTSYILEISLCEEDILHLEKFKMSLKSNTPIKIKTIQNKYKACRITICNKKICEDLIKLGCTPKKSLTLKFPNEKQVPKKLIPHFIRGYLDGDGCVYNGEYGMSISLVGTRNFLESIQNIINEELGLTKTKINKKGKAYQCQWRGVGNAKSWFDYLYNYDDIIYLQRKFEKFFAQ